MDYYVNEFLKAHQLKVDDIFRVTETGKIVKVDSDGSFIDCNTDSVLNLGEVFSILSGAYQVEKDTTRYVCGDEYYYVNTNNEVVRDVWEDDIFDYAMLYMGNVFTTRLEAESAKDNIINLCHDVNTKKDDLEEVGFNNFTATPKVEKKQSIAEKFKLTKDTTDTDDSGISSLVMSIDTDDIKSGNYKGYTLLHRGGKVDKKDFSINADSLYDALQEAFKKGFNS
nr:MAG TPA: hypothetical protein [Caudoviricetes sp.]